MDNTKFDKLEFEKFANMFLSDELKRENIIFERWQKTVDSYWLSIYIKEIKTYAPRTEKDYGKKLICWQNVYEFTAEWLFKRLLTMLINYAKQRQQDVNGILWEYRLIKKPIEDWYK